MIIVISCFKKKKEFVDTSHFAGITSFRRQHFRARRSILRIPGTMVIRRFRSAKHSVRFADGQGTLQKSNKPTG